MMLAKVIGTVVATVKYPTLEGRKLLLIQPVTPTGAPRGKPLVAIDAVGAGESETVYWCRGKEAALAFDSEVVSDASIVGIVDEITSHGSASAAGVTTSTSDGPPAKKAGAPASTGAPRAPDSGVRGWSSRQSREHPAPARGRR